MSSKKFFGGFFHLISDCSWCSTRSVVLYSIICKSFIVIKNYFNFEYLQYSFWKVFSILSLSFEWKKWTISGWVIRASDCLCRSCNSPWFNHSILKHCGIWGPVEEAVETQKYSKNKLKIIPHNCKITDNIIGETKEKCNKICLLVYLLVTLRYVSSRHC